MIYNVDFIAQINCHELQNPVGIGNALTACEGVTLYGERIEDERKEEVKKMYVKGTVSYGISRRGLKS